MKRHISRMHQNDNENEITDEIVQEVPQAVPAAEVTSVIPESLLEEIPNKTFENKPKEFKDIKDFSETYNFNNMKNSLRRNNLT